MWSTDNLFSGRVPSRIIIALVKTKNYLGSHATSPYNFEHFNLSFMSFEIDNCPYPKEPYKPNYGQDLFIEEVTGRLMLLQHALFGLMGKDCKATIAMHCGIHFCSTVETRPSSYLLMLYKY